MEEWTIENTDIAVFETASDEYEAFDEATGLADEYPGRKFYIHYYGRPFAVVWWENGHIHTKDLMQRVEASVRYRGARYSKR